MIHGVVPDTVRAKLDERQAIRRELGIADDEFVCVTVANYREQKDYPNLLAAARRVLDTHPDVRFVAVGQGQLEAAVHAEHERLGLEGRFILIGSREDAVAVMAAADMGVHARRVRQPGAEPPKADQDLADRAGGGGAWYRLLC